MDSSLFISNLHTDEVKSNIEQLFSQFGSIAFCHIFKDKYGKGRGFGLVTFTEKCDRDDALKAKFTSLGKNINVLRYIKDNKELEKRDAALSKLKVCIMGVPKGVTDEDLTHLMECHFGEVRHCYVRDDPKKNKNIGFATFQYESQAQQALDMRIVKLKKSETLTFKKFQVKSKFKINLEKMLRKNKISIVNRAQKPSKNSATKNWHKSRFNYLNNSSESNVNSVPRKIQNKPLQAAKLHQINSTKNRYMLKNKHIQLNQAQSMHKYQQEQPAYTSRYNPHQFHPGSNFKMAPHPQNPPSKVPRSYKKLRTQQKQMGRFNDTTKSLQELIKQTTLTKCNHHPNNLRFNYRAYKYY